MAARLGEVIYWAGCLFGALFVVAAVYVYAVDPGSRDGQFLAALVGGFGVACWLIGRAAKYVLAGR